MEEAKICGKKMSGSGFIDPTEPSSVLLSAPDV